jgi:hypothetical protein
VGEEEVDVYSVVEVDIILTLLCVSSLRLSLDIFFSYVSSSASAYINPSTQQFLLPHYTPKLEFPKTPT